MRNREQISLVYRRSKIIFKKYRKPSKSHVEICISLILDGNCAELVAQLFAEELLPVAAKAQKKVPVPEGYAYRNSINFCKLKRAYLQTV